VGNGSSRGDQDQASLAATYRGVAPGWYQDAADPALARYWDGTTLSEKTQPVAASDALSGVPDAAVAGPEEGANPVKMSRLDKMSVKVARAVTLLLGRTN